MLLALLANPASGFTAGVQDLQQLGRNTSAHSLHAHYPAAKLRHTSALEPFRVVHYRLDLRFPMTGSGMGGRNSITLVVLNPLDSLEFNAVALIIDSVHVNGTPRQFTLKPSEEKLVVYAGLSLVPGDTVRVDVDYPRDTTVTRPSDREGYYWYSDTLAGLPAPLGYTFSEPSNARCWMPCFDEPWQKATAEIHATVPDGFVAASNGRFLGVVENGDATKTWNWQETHQIAPYLIAVTISKWTISTLPFLRSHADTVPVQYFVWSADSAACAQYLPTVVHMIGNLSVLFGPYPFDKYGMTGVTPFSYGGMEHQTITTLARSVETSENVVVHELSHQWWGDLVTCATWKDIWLNESFASYAEALWQESLGGQTALRQYMVNNHLQFQMGSWTGAIYDPEGQGFPLFSNNVYSKGAWVLHMLRGILGDTTFFHTLLAYRARFSGGAATTDDFANIVDSVSGRDMRWFFNEWIYGRGWPEYATKFSWLTDTLTLTVYQEQDSLWQSFKMPLAIRVYGGGGDTTLHIVDSLRVQEFRCVLSFPPDSVLLDPDQWVLKRIVAAPLTGVNTIPVVPSQFRLLQNSPNPFNPTTEIKYTIGVDSRQLTVDSKVRLSVYDLLGREVAVLVNGYQTPGEHLVRFDARTLASGVYFYRLVAGGQALSRKLILLK